MLLGIIACYQHQKIVLLEIAPATLNNAEEKVPRNRMRWCVERLYSVVVPPLNVIFTKKTIKIMLKGVYDEMRRYA